MNLYNKNAEQALLGSILQEKSILHQIDLLAEDFYWEKNQRIFQACLDLTREGKEINIITVSEKSSVDVSFIAEAVTSAISHGKSLEYAKIIADYSKKRKILRILNQGDALLETNNANEIATILGNELLSIMQATEKEDSSIKTAISNLEKEQIINIEKRERGDEFLGTPTGIKSLDKETQGIRKPYYWIVNAYTSVGKTWFALNIVSSFLNQGKRVVFFSLEMTQEDLAARIVAIRTGINSLSISSGFHLNDPEEIEAKAILYEQNISIHKRKRNIEEILMTMVSENMKKPVDLFVIDYLQHIKSPKAKDKYTAYTDASNDIQDMCQHLGVPTLMLSQIDNASARSKQTDIIATKGSGDVGGDADVAILLQMNKDRTDCYTEGHKGVDCYIQKQRHGVTGKIELILETKSGKYYDAKDYGK